MSSKSDAEKRKYFESEIKKFPHSSIVQDHATRAINRIDKKTPKVDTTISDYHYSSDSSPTVNPEHARLEAMDKDSLKKKKNTTYSPQAIGQASYLRGK